MKTTTLAVAGRRRLVRAVILALGTCFLGAALAAQTTRRSQFAGRVAFDVLAPEGGDDRFVVYYDDSSALADDLAALTAELRRVASTLPANLTLEHVRRLATGGHLVMVRDSSGDASQALLDRAAAEDLMIELATNPAVRYVEPDARVTLALTPKDPRYKDQWPYFQAVGGTNTAGAWHYATGTGIRVAVIDTGITPHSDLAANVVGGYDFLSDAATARDGDGRDPDPNDEGDWFEIGDCPGPADNDAQNSSWHGTHVAGIVAAVANNDKGVAGVAHHAQVVPVRVLGKCGGYFSDVAEAIIWASGGSVPAVPPNPYPAQVINLSLSGYGPCPATLQNAIDAAIDNDTVVVAASGNDSQDVSTHFPANCGNVISVAALTNNGTLAPYSNYGNHIDVAAPGSIVSTMNDGTTIQGNESYIVYQGTSIAAPQVAGLAALILSKTPRTPAQVEGLIKYNGTSGFGNCASDPIKSCGSGLIDALHTMRATLAGYTGDIPVSPALSQFFEPTFFQNPHNYSAPGNSTIQLPNTVWGRYSGNAPANLTVKMNFMRGGTTATKLKIELLAPDNSVVAVLHNQQATIQSPQAVNASGKVADGLWKLRVTNFDSSTNGYFDSWSLTFPWQFDF